MSGKIILYDLPCKGRCRGWSPNVWKTRMVLNYKQLPYETKWLSHPEIAPALQELGVPPNEPSSGNSPYSLPTIILPDGTLVMESTAIATKLETLHPSPPLHLDNGILQKLGPLIGKTMLPLIPVFMPRIGREVIVESSVEYFQKARAERFGMTLDELEKAKGGKQAWDAARPGLEAMQKLLEAEKRDEGPFITGSEPCYADFVVAGMIEALRRIGEDLYENFLATAGEGRLAGVHKACEKWMENDQ